MIIARVVIISGGKPRRGGIENHVKKEAFNSKSQVVKSITPSGFTRQS